MGITYLDLAPYRRSTVGFDRLFDRMNSVKDDADTYPPYDIVREGDDAYRITLSVAGYARDELDVVAERNLLTVSGRKSESENGEARILHRGIATPASFERRFELADFIEVEDARFEHGLLTIELKRKVPDDLKPHRIEIASGAGPQPDRA